ncbi:MAG: disulfide bond formation protein B [Proteobacteria bacterium]|nr:disulfide bond formation protein B [Pseudomonadota bacterium]
MSSADPGAHRRRQINLLGALGCGAMMAFALYAQYVLHLQPCNMCVLQRIAVSALGVVFLLAALQHPGVVGARLYALLIAVAATAGLALAGRHVWMSLQPLGSLPSCGADFYAMLDMLPPAEVAARIWNGGAECQIVAWRFLGLSMQAWVLVGVGLLGGAGVWANLTAGRRAR